MKTVKKKSIYILRVIKKELQIGRKVDSNGGWLAVAAPT